MPDHNPYSPSAQRSRRTGSIVVGVVLLCGFALLYGPLLVSVQESGGSTQIAGTTSPGLANSGKSGTARDRSPGTPVPNTVESSVLDGLVNSFARNANDSSPATALAEDRQPNLPFRQAYLSWINSDSRKAYCSALADALTLTPESACPEVSWKRLGHSVDGKPVLGAFDLGTTNASRILVVSGLRGNDISSARTVLRWATRSRSQHSAWVFVPVANPDSLIGRTDSGTNRHGVTLNRNWPTIGWSHTSRLAEPASLDQVQIDPGASPGSEPEIKTLIRLISIYKPTQIVYLNSGDGLITLQGRTAAHTDWAPFLTAYEPPAPGSIAEYALEKGIDFITVSLPPGTEAKKYSALVWAKLHAAAERRHN